jgi:undecaprenyl-diphosphatase
MVVPDIRLLVGCGGGYSFPSSHAVNNFGVATLLALYYRRAAPWVFGWAVLVALSRPAVGVHYPSDAAAGAAVGLALGYLLVLSWTSVQVRFLPRWGIQPGKKEPT